MHSEKKVAIVTGAGRGIGLAIAKRFTEMDVSVICAEIDEGLEDNLRRKIPHGDVHFIHTDVSDERSVKELVERTARVHGKIDFLVNNAAIARPHYGNVLDLDVEAFERVVDVNLKGAFMMSRYAGVHLKQSRGAIVNIASTRSLMSEANSEPYAASKAGLVGLTHAMAISLGPEVRVNCISPGWIVTDEYMPEDEGETKLSEADHKQHPAGRVGYPEDVAEMAAYLCSDKAGFITGQNFVIDGGMTKKMIYV